jgi:hypothetical protein
MIGKSDPDPTQKRERSYISDAVEQGELHRGAETAEYLRFGAISIQPRVRNSFYNTLLCSRAASIPDLGHFTHDLSIRPRAAIRRLSALIKLDFASLRVN